MPDPMSSTEASRVRRPGFDGKSPPAEPSGRRRRLWAVLPVCAGFAVFGAVVWMAYQDASLGPPNGEPPLIRAAPEAIKLPPDPPRDPKEKAPRWKWTADMALTGEQTVLTGQLGSNRTDTLDYFAYWKTFDMALEAAFAGRDAASLRADPRLVDMGTWSDGWPMKRLTADIPKVEGEAEKLQAGPRRRIN